MRYVKTFDELFESRTTTKEEIMAKLKKGYVEFIYFKKKGEMRTAYGTLEPRFLKKYGVYKRKTTDEKYTRGIRSAKKMGYIVYFDLIRNGYRMFTFGRTVQLILNYKKLSEIKKLHPKIKSKLALFKDFPSGK